MKWRPPSRATSFRIAVQTAPLKSRLVLISEPQAWLDVADVERQITWHKAQGRVDKSVSGRDVVDLSFVK
jgi:hypothetical protein